MDIFLSEFWKLLWPWSIVYSLAVYLITYCIRLIVEKAWPKFKEPTSWWSEVVIHIVPLLLGGIFVQIANLIPANVSPSRFVTVIYGVVLGGFCGFTYMMAGKVQGVLQAKAEAALPAALKAAEDKTPVPGGGA